MTELGDYRRLVEKPMIEAHIAELRRKDAEIERLRAENEKLRRWRALDKPLTAAMEIANSHLAPMCAENERLRAALEMICGRRPCPDNLLGNADIARLAIDGIARDALEQKGPTDG